MDYIYYCKSFEEVQSTVIMCNWKMDINKMYNLHEQDSLHREIQQNVIIQP